MTSGTSGKICVSYHYFESGDVYKENFLHFLTFGYDEAIDYFVVVSGKYTFELPKLPNVTYAFAKNKNYDFGGHAHAVNHLIDAGKYDYFLFINSSVRGPYLPPYYRSSWTTPFLEQLDAETKLVGTTINILPTGGGFSNRFKLKYGGEEPFSHVQSMAYAMDREALLFLKRENFFDSKEILSKFEVIRDYEILLSQKIIRNGWNIACLLPEYNRVDYRKPHQEINEAAHKGDAALSRHAYFGRTVHPYEVIFVKTNRSLYPVYFLEMLSYTALLAKLPRLPLIQRSPASFIPLQKADRQGSKEPTVWQAIDLLTGNLKLLGKALIRCAKKWRRTPH